mmetsp:Transcript_13027/g.15456  ORF Transcript_13027/g.15456 Transcript_13027/m.15456 type:complete len:194 (+) Transcript_13027:392-973(+)|eukprot:jgi/Bigna1/86401/estExt_fgenesh1_pg.C_100174
MSKKKPEHPFFFVKFGPDLHSRAIFNSSCRCHILLDAIKDICVKRLESAIRKRLGEIYDEVNQIRKNIRKLELKQRVPQSRRESIDTSQSSDKAGGDEKGNSRQQALENKIKAEKEEEEKRNNEEESLNKDLEMISTMNIVDIASDDGKDLKLRENREEYAYTLVQENLTYKLLKIERDEHGGESATTVEVNA